MENMNNRQLLKTTTPQEKEMIKKVMERAREKQKEKEGDNIKLLLQSHMEERVYGN